MTTVCLPAELKFRIPKEAAGLSGDAPDQGVFRVSYRPSDGYRTASNFTVDPSLINQLITINDVLPGTQYTFQLYYSNGSVQDKLLWTSELPTTPDPPVNLTVTVLGGKVAEASWEAPKRGGYTGFKLSLIPHSEKDDIPVRNNYISHVAPFLLRDLTPGASYEVQLFSVFHGQDSSTFVTTNFTTKPNTPGRFIVWFRNETTLLVLWQPPYPSGIFEKYRVSIAPEDALQSELLVDKERDPPGPAQAAFYGLVPGRNYNISVQTVSQNQISEPTKAQYRTVPLPPTNVTYDKNKLESFAFDVRWDPPKKLSEFDRYQVALGIRNTVRYLIDKDEERVVTFDEDLEPGSTYEVVVKTVSGNVASWPVTANVTTRPLPVRIVSSSSENVGEIFLKWEPSRNSTQDSYRVKYSDMEAFNSGGSLLVVRNTSINLTSLLPGRNYSISVSAVSKRISSDPTVIYQATKPSAPVIELLQPGPSGGWNLSWKSDVTSRQDQYSVMYIRNDTRYLQEKLTKHNFLIISDLYPGAGYEIKVYAISFGLWSEPHSYFQIIPPMAPQGLQVVKASSTNMILLWSAPSGSLYDHYNVRYQLTGATFWREMGTVNTTSCEIKDLVPGEKYAVQVTSVSKKVESLEAEEITQTMYPKPIKKVKEILDSNNITFEWEVPQGHRDYYIIFYNPIDDPKNQKSHQVAANSTKPMENMSVIIGELKPGELYTFRFFAVSHNMRSEGVTVQTRTKPVIDSVINVVIDEHSTKTLGIKYTPTPRRTVVFDRYRFKLNDESIPVQEKLFNDTNRLVIFDNLVPGKLYDITIWTVSGGVNSVPIQRQTRLYPEPITKITPISVTDTEIALKWERPPGEMDGYEIEYQDPLGYHLIKNMSLSETNTFRNLKPHHNYTFQVSVVSGYGTATTRRSSLVSQTFHTLESVPGRVHFFRAVDVKPNEITLQWSLPTNEQNGILTGYKITYYIKGANMRQYKYFEPPETKGTLFGLQPGMEYVFEIQAHTKVGPGGTAICEETTPIWAPPQPEPHIAPKMVTRTSNSIKIEFSNNFFSNENGMITAYAIIVAEDDTQDSNSLRMPTWAEVQQYSVWPPYQVQAPFYPFNYSFREDFTIGTENCNGVKGYCNGPLKPATSYRVKIRAYTTPITFTDTVYSVQIQTDADNKALLASIFTPLILVVLLMGVGLLWRRRRLAPFAKKAKHAKSDAMSIAESEVITNRPIKLKDFADHYRLMSADSDFRFAEEFELLKNVGRDRPCHAADLPVNRPKNRFTNILPYDHSRIKLMPTDDEEGTDYINANYIPGYNSPREFIVTQGPLHSTRDDFWRMIWEQNCRAIVMLTRCIEKGREKCDHYWPFDMQPVYYGDIQVILLNESQYLHWTISEFKVSRNEQSRVVKHFHFTTWPDFGVPEPPQVLVKFVRTFRERIGTDPKPICVHCSAGVGRSGTFIALDRILQHIQKFDYADIFGFVHEMRKERVWMVQNEQQYICIHQCLMCVLEKKEEVLELGRPEAHDNQGYDDDEGIAESGI
ncbi:tyrosine-protein phosphatase 10D-like [Uloborus diversus]|uniref:tyrosine-protein phosphatase 10D-like n=1 Tax=Uloborus diversus TaxID=327109 RepID=UPI002409479D|nr:tyrosine-protein phosphatase 10D-like [Uloborus diversus]